MDNVKLIKTILVVAVIFIVIGFFGFYFFRTEDKPILRGAVPGGGSPESREIQLALNALEGLVISGDVFKLPAFGSLVDFTRTVNPEDKQRPNPFAPIGAENRGRGGRPE